MFKGHFEQILEFSFRTEPILLAETETHTESVSFLYEELHIKNNINIKRHLENLAHSFVEIKNVTKPT